VKKIFSIVLALALVLTAVVASTVPAGAVTAGTVNVCLSDPIALQTSDYCISFHNGSLLKGDNGDFIDVMFPYGTDASGATVMRVMKSPAPPPAPPFWCMPCICANSTAWAAPATAVTLGTIQYEPGYIRIELAGGQVIEKCYFVLIVIANVVNPTSCNHHLQVGTSTHTPTVSNDYTIYCAKIDLVGGVNPATGMAMMNLISLPCYPLDTSIEVVLASLFLQAQATAGSANPFSFSVWYWDNVAKVWEKYVSDTSFSDLQTIEPGKAYWVKPSSDATIYIHGTPYPPGQGPPVKWCYPFSWNMVGFASLSNMAASDYLAYTVIPFYGDAVLAIWSYNSAPGVQWYVDTGWPGVDPTLVPGQGYWMAFIAEACIIPPV